MKTIRLLAKTTAIMFALQFAATASHAANKIAPTMFDEVEALFDVLRDSGCEFYRNGEWYPADKAESHLRRKFDYGAKRRSFATAEEFIDGFASASSMSGEPYLVKCADEKAMRSGDWFRAALQRFRDAAGR
jgi:hypothetical protein